jgi:hypothetical protein
MGVERHYAELMFLHPAESMGHVGHPRASGAQNVESLFFMLMRDQCGFDKKMCMNTLHQTCVFGPSGICGSRSAFPYVRGVKC